jgi:hypothetical protein
MASITKRKGKYLVQIRRTGHPRCANSDGPKVPDNTEYFIGEIKYGFEAQLQILYSLFKKELEGRLGEISILAGSTCSTGKAICTLSSDPEHLFAETTMLARSFIEKVVNFCYLLICDEDDYKNFLSYPYYRIFHNLDRQKTAGKHTIYIYLKFTGIDEVKNHPTIAEALSRFSPKNPRLKWSKKSVDKKVAAIQQRSSIHVAYFLLNTLSIYSDASEALHGSLYGCAFHLGIYEPGLDPTDAENVKSKVLKKLALLLVQLSSMVSETIKLISTLHPMEQELKRVEIIENRNVESMKALFGKKDDN